MSINAFMNWSLRLYRAFGIEVRVHWLLIIILVLQMLQALQKFGTSALIWSPAIALLVFLLVLLHEYGHCIAARRMGGSADTIILWPLGGLAMVSCPHTPRAELITSAGGLLVNAILLVLGFLFRKSLMLAAGGDGLVTYFIEVFNEMNLTLILFNLIPCFPLDGGRIFNAILWPIVGYDRALQYTLWLALIISAGLSVYFIFQLNIFFAIAAILVFLQAYKILKMRSLDAASMLIYGTPRSYSRSEQGVPLVQSLQEAREAKRTAQSREMKKKTMENIDQILDKINRVGIEGLTGEERKMLDSTSKFLREKDK